MIEWTDRLSDYLDGELSGEERERLESALEGDAELRRILEELRAVRDRAASLPRTEPESDLWPGIASRIRESDSSVLPMSRAGRTRRRFSFTAPQLAAAAVALLAIGSGTVWVVGGPRGEPVTPGPSVAGTPANDVGGAERDVGLASTDEGPAFSYEETIRDLEERVQIGRDRLSPETVEALETSLATIDRAIASAREALEADPANVYLNRHLAEARTRKLYVLQQAALLATS